MIAKRKQINNLETLKVLSDPFRVQLLATIRNMNEKGELATVKVLAKRFSRSPKKLYYHINLLEKHDLIHVANTRLVSGIVEKQYQVTAINFVIDESLFSWSADREEEKDTVVSMVSGLLETTKNEVAQLARVSASRTPESLGKKPANLIFKDYAHLTVEQIQTFQKHLQEIVEAFDAIGTDPGREATQYYSLTTVFFPVVEE